VLKQIDSTFPCQRGDPIEPVLRGCSDTLEQLHDILAPFRQELEDNKIKQYVKGLRIRSRENKIQSAVKRLQSQKLTLTLALLASSSRSDSESTLLVLPGRTDRHDVDLESQFAVGSGTNGWDVKTLTRIIDQRVSEAAQQLRHNPASDIEDLLGLEETQINELLRFHFESVRNLKSM